MHATKIALPVWWQSHHVKRPSLSYTRGTRDCAAVKNRAARESVWRPNCNMHVEHIVIQCAKCAETWVECSTPRLWRPLIPDRLWQRLVIDLFQVRERRPDSWLLIPVSRSGLHGFNHGSSSHLGNQELHCPLWHPRHCADRQYAAVCVQQVPRVCAIMWFPAWDLRYLQSNGEAEHMVRMVKYLLSKGPDPYLSFLS